VKNKKADPIFEQVIGIKKPTGEVYSPVG